MKKLHIARYFFTTICIVGFFAFISPVSTEIKPDGTAQIGEACTSSSQCVTGNCEDSYCVCNDKGASEGSAHCAARYGTSSQDAVNWQCLDDSEDKRKYHGDHLQFCQHTSFPGGTKPEISNDKVKYPQDKKSLMGHACNSTANCITDNSDSLDSWCEETQFDSSNDPSSPYYDPWYTPGKKLKVCECGGEDLSETSTLCALQYGGTASDWPSTGESVVSVCAESTSPELQRLQVCRRSNNWMPKTLVEMRSSVAPRDNNSVQTTFLGFDISTQAPELVTPETKIKIPGVFFSKITRESNITTDDFGASWLNIPFLGEFISAIYKYSVGLISLIAVLVLIISGVQIITSAGNSEAISSAKHRIVSSVIAIAITAGSYTILYTVNPDLVNLKNLKILVVPGIPLDGVQFIDSKDYEKITGQKILPPSEYDPLVIKAATAASLDVCIAKTIVTIESRGNPHAIGHDENAQNPRINVGARMEFLMSGKTMQGKQFTPPFTNSSSYKPADHNPLKITNDDTFNPNSPPNYGLDFERYGHGIGLGQIQVFKTEWCGSERGRRIGSNCYTIKDLLTPEKNIQAMIEYMKSNLQDASSKGFSGESQIMASFRAYNAGQGSVQRSTTPKQLAENSYVAKAMQYYNSCKATPSTYTPDGTTVPAPPQTGQRKIAIIGSSTFDHGCFYGGYEGFVKLLRKEYPSYSFICSTTEASLSGQNIKWALGGTNSTRFRQMFDTYVSTKGYDDVIVFGDLNGLQGSPETTVRNNLSHIFSTAKSQGTRVIVVGPQPHSPKRVAIEAQNAWLATLANEGAIDIFIHAYPLLDTNNDGKIDQSYSAGDDLHVNRNGHKLLFDLIKQAAY